MAPAVINIRLRKRGFCKQIFCIGDPRPIRQKSSSVEKFRFHHDHRQAPESVEKVSLQLRRFEFT
jgi:hypothetical protein